MNSSKGQVIFFLSMFLSISLTGWGQSGLDSGPWPTQDHDNRRSNQSGFPGPTSPGTPQLIYDALSPILNELVITSEGKLILAGCSSQVVANQVVAIDAAGRPAWPAPYTLIANNNESPVGYTVDAFERVYVAVHDCPDIPGAVPVHLYALSPNGTSAPNWPIGFPAVYEPPAIGADGTVYQMDELTTLHALRPSDGSTVWNQGFCCFGQGAIALDSAGNLYAGADGDFFGSGGLWSWSPSGALRWTALSGISGTVPDMLFGTTAISPADKIFISSLSGKVYAFNADGALLPGWPFATGSPPPSDSQRDPLAVGASETVYIKTLSAIFAINPDGTKKWTYSPGGDGSLSPAVVLDSNENVYFAFGNMVYSLTSSGAFRWNAPVNVPGRLYIGGSGILYVVSGNQKLYSINDGFLSFPLLNKTAYSAAINSVFDHTTTAGYCADGVVTAYTGEQGTALNGSPDPVANYTCGVTGKKNALYGFLGVGGPSEPFSVNGHYRGGGMPEYLYYDGHPGYDYRTTDQDKNGILCTDPDSECYQKGSNPNGKTPVLAAAAGTVVCVIGTKQNPCPGGSPAFDPVVILHDNGYSTIYLHMDSQSIYVKVGDRVASQQMIGLSGEAGVPNNPHLHFEVHNPDRIPVDPYGWIPDSKLPNFGGSILDPYKRAVSINLWK